MLCIIKYINLKKTFTIKESPALLSSPFRKGVTKRTRAFTPRKPNSAKRPMAKIVMSAGNRITAHIPGSLHNVRRHSRILVRGHGARDMPGTPYRCVRGPYDCAPVPGKKRRRSIYGLLKADKKVRLKYMR